MSFRIEKGQIIPSPKTRASTTTRDVDFGQVLQESIRKKASVKISSHAQQRMEERQISLKESDLNLINEAMNKLEKKGSRESLMIYKDMAFIASVNNRTIITAMRDRDIDVVTNIDSAIVVK